VSPSFWYVDKTHGGAYGFNTETSPGPAIPQPDSLVKFLPPQNRWPIDKVWDYHAGGGGYTNLDLFNAGMRTTYGWPNSMDAYSRISQTMTYDGERAMFEAYTRNKYTSTGVVQWMLNNAWPSIIWHLYDYYLQTGGGYYGTKKACEPVHVQYSYDDHSIYAVSSLPVTTPSLTVEADVYDLDLKPVFHQTKMIDLAADGSQRVLDIPDTIFQPEDSTHFVRLEMKNASGKTISRNFYRKYVLYAIGLEECIVTYTSKRTSVENFGHLWNIVLNPKELQKEPSVIHCIHGFRTEQHLQPCAR